jgi:hypothetical protein
MMNDRRALLPRDFLAPTKMIGDIGTGQTENKSSQHSKNANAANLGRPGRVGRIRAFSPEKRIELAQKATAKAAV